MFFVTINTNHKPKTAPEEASLKRALEKFVWEEFATMTVWNQLIETTSEIKNVHIEAGVETARTTGFIHAHCHVTIEHNGLITLRKTAQSTLQQIAKKTLRTNGAYVQITLGDSRFLNYANKEGNQYSAGIQESVVFD